MDESKCERTETGLQVQQAIDFWQSEQDRAAVADGSWRSVVHREVDPQIRQRAPKLVARSLDRAHAHADTAACCSPVSSTPPVPGF
jgi:hypothetical protein